MKQLTIEQRQKKKEKDQIKKERKIQEIKNQSR